MSIKEHIELEARAIRRRRRKMAYRIKLAAVLGGTYAAALTYILMCGSSY